MARKKNKGKPSRQEDSDDSDGDAHLAALLGGKLGTKYGSDSDDDDVSDDNAPPARGKGRQQQPAAASSKKNKKKKASDVLAAAAMAESSDESEQEDDDDDDKDTADDGKVQQAVTKLADDGWGALLGGDGGKKKKKDKKEKKEKKEKKSKQTKQKSHDSDDEKDDAANGQRGVDATPAEPPKQVEEKKKSKFELQMEAKLAATKAAEEKAAPKVDEKDKKQKRRVASGMNQLATMADDDEPAVDDDDDDKQNADNGDDDGVLYGAPDDHAWTDKSLAIKAAEDGGDSDEDDTIPHVGPDGKKISNKERKKLMKAKQAAQREAQYEAAAAKASREGAQFACSQTAVNESDSNWENALDINIPSFSISAAGKILFKDAAFNIAHGRRYGLVGPNGRGKSTLLKMIASKDLKLPPRIDFLYVEQEVFADDTPAVEAVLQADVQRWDLLEEEKTLMAAIDKGDESEEKIDRLQHVVDELINMGSDAAEAKARRILFGLGFTMDMQTKPTKMFSGGWRMRISLARALFVEPTLLMLDEPSNHLDVITNRSPLAAFYFYFQLNAVIWLDEYLQKWKKTLLIVSHDQDFLNSVCQEMLHIEDLKLVSYKGNYDSFKKMEKVKFEQHIKAWEKQEKRLRELKKQGQSKSKAHETVKKDSKRETGARNQKKKNAAIASGNETAETTELITRPREYQVKLHFPEVAEISRPVMEVTNVHFRYSPKHPVIFDCVDFGIDMDSRICIVGPNGAGKSTLLKLLTGEVVPTKGEVRRNPRLRMGIYNQHFVDRLPMDKSPVEHLRDRYPDEDYQSVRNRLGKYGLEGHAHEVTMRDLSGGQKARVVFVDLSLQCPHILLLDEPTNNLDIETIDALCDAVNEFNGGVVVVTHDQRLIEECNCNLWVVEKLGVTEWKEGFDDYKETILRELEEQVAQEAATRREKLEVAAQAKAEKLSQLAKKLKKKG